VSFPAVTSISAWAKSQVSYLGGDETLPYALKNGMYHYFTFDGTNYVLQMTSEKDLQENRK
jgi:hypothetical protein